MSVRTHIGDQVTHRGCHRAGPASMRAVQFQVGSGDEFVCLSVGIKERPTRGRWGERGAELQFGDSGGRIASGLVWCGPFGVEAPVLIVEKLAFDPLVDGRERIMEDGDHRHAASRSCTEVCGLCECGLKMDFGALRAILRGDFARGSFGTRLSLCRRTCCAGGAWRSDRMGAERKDRIWRFHRGGWLFNLKRLQ